MSTRTIVLLSVAASLASVAGLYLQWQSLKLERAATTGATPPRVSAGPAVVVGSLPLSTEVMR